MRAVMAQKHANIELDGNGGARVWADFPNVPAALRAVELLLTINPEAFTPVPVAAAEIAHRDNHTADGGGVIPHGVAEAMMRDGVPPDDDEGDIVPDPRACPAGGGCDD